MRKTILLVALCACGPGVNPVEVQKPLAPEQGSAPPASTCDFDRWVDPSQGVLVGATQGEAFLIRADGTRVTLVSSGGSTSSWISMPLSRGQFIAVTSTALVEQRYQSQVALFDSHGQRLASAEDASGGYLSEAGVVAALGPTGNLVLVRKEGTVTKEGLSPAAEFGPGGLLPVWSNGSTRTLALYDTDRDTLQPLPVPLAGWAPPVWSGDTLVYIGQLEGDLVLVRQSPTQIWATRIVGAEANQGLQVEAISGTRAMLVAGSWVKSRATLDLETGVLTPLVVKLPEGSTFAGGRALVLADDGALVAALAQAGAAGLFASADGQSWTGLGPRVEGATRLQFAGRSGTWLVAPTGLLPSNATATLGFIPSLAHTEVLPALASGQGITSDAISADGRCAALWHATADGFGLTAADLVRGTQRELTSLPADARPTGLGWIQAR